MASSAMATMAGPPPYSPSPVDGLRVNRAASVIPLPRRRRRRCSSAFTVRAEGGINPDIRKNEAKVVDSVVASELAKPLTAYCRCWRSGTFPLCDGSHVKHNKATGDNVGPLLVKK